MSKKKKNVYADSMKLQDLEFGVYGVRINNFNPWPFFHGRVSLYFIVVEFSGRPIIVEIPDESRSILQVAMGKMLEDITDEDGFTVHKDGSVTNNRG